MTTDQSARVLVVDDDPGVRQALTRALSFEGYDVSEGADGLAALDGADDADVMVLDVTMPNLNGFDVCRRLRERGSDVPILVLTARHSTADRVEGLDAGADDYLVKPFSLDELLARLRALLRRHGPSSADDGDVAAFSDLVVDRAAHRVTRDGVPVELTRTEFALLELLVTHPDQVLTRDQIYEAVWGYDSTMASNSLEVYVGYLRRKTEVGGAPRLVHTVRGVGYVLREP